MHRMPEDFSELFAIDWHGLLERSIQNVPDSYYRPLEVAHIANACPDWLRVDAKEALAQYTERDWCYELYHQLRLLLTCISKKHKIVNKVRLAGEPSKQATYQAVWDRLIWQENSRSQGEVGDNSVEDGWTDKKNCRIPDILLHDPAGVGYQVFAIEAKRARRTGKLSEDKLADDLTALSEYITGLGYIHGFFIGLGLDKKALDETLVALVGRQRDKVKHAADRITIYLVEDGANLPDGRRIQRMGLDSSTLTLCLHQ